MAMPDDTILSERRAAGLARRLCAPVPPRLAALVLLGLFTACSVTPDRDCGVDPQKRPFGRRIKVFVAEVEGIPDALEEEFEVRGDLLGREWYTLVEGRKREVDATSEHLDNFFPAIEKDVDYHGGQFVDFFGRATDRAEEDTHCFLARAWHSLKLFE